MDVNKIDASFCQGKNKNRQFKFKPIFTLLKKIKDTLKGHSRKMNIQIKQTNKVKETKRSGNNTQKRFCKQT